jgi:hypothetical protein
MDQFLWVNLFLTSRSFHPYFIWNFWSWVGPPSDQISLNLFELILNPTVHPGHGPLRVSPGRPTRARAPLLTPLPPLSRGPCISRVGAPLPKQRHAAAGMRSGRRPSVGARRHARPRAAWRPHCPFKTESPPAGRFFSPPLPRARFFSPHSNAPTAAPLASIYGHSTPRPLPTAGAASPAGTPPSRAASSAPSSHRRRFRLARHLPLFLRELSSPDSPHLIARSDVAGRASLTPHGDHRRRVRSAPCPSRSGRLAVGPHPRAVRL